MPNPLCQTTGRRKEAVARVRLRPGAGAITINGRTVENYFPTATHRMILSEPLRLTNTAEAYDVDCSIIGGGVSGQAGALRMGIARALIEAGSGAPTPAQEGRIAHPRRPQEGIQEVRPEESAKSAAILQAVISSSSELPSLPSLRH